MIFNNLNELYELNEWTAADGFYIYILSFVLHNNNNSITNRGAIFGKC